MFEGKRIVIVGTFQEMSPMSSEPPLTSYDFLFDTTENGRTIKLMPILDEYTSADGSISKEGLSIVVARSITSERVIHRC